MTRDELIQLLGDELGDGDSVRFVFSRLNSLGYVIRPREPTEEMVKAGNDCGFDYSDKIYRAMIGAAEGKGEQGLTLPADWAGKK